MLVLWIRPIFPLKSFPVTFSSKAKLDHARRTVISQQSKLTSIVVKSVVTVLTSFFQRQPHYCQCLLIFGLWNFLMVCYWFTLIWIIFKFDVNSRLYFHNLHYTEHENRALGSLTMTSYSSNITFFYITAKVITTVLSEQSIPRSRI